MQKRKNFQIKPKFLLIIWKKKSKKKERNAPEKYEQGVAIHVA
jgi:hypothetical protein